MPLIGDLSQDTPVEIKKEVGLLLEELGNPLHALPFYVLYPKNGKPVVIADAPIFQGALIKKLTSALESGSEVASAAGAVATE